MVPTLSITVSPFTGDAALPDRVDVVVIGGGIVGVSTALTLAERKISVLLCEKGVIGAEQSGRNWGWTRQMGRDPAEIPLAMASLRLWGGMNARVGGETGFRRTGIAYLCHTEADLALWGGWLAKGRDHGLPSAMLSPREAADLLPGSAVPLLGALHTPTDGRAEPALATVAMAEAARRAGARIVTGCAVRGVERTGGAVSGVVTERGRVACSAAVLAGGAWSRLFAGNMGLDFPQLKVLGTVARVSGATGLSGMPVGAADFAYRQRLDGDHTIALRNANVAPITPDGIRLFPEYAASFLATWRELRLRVGRSFLEEWRVPKRWSLDAPSPFEAVRTLDPRPARSFTGRALARLSRAYPAFAGARVVGEWAGLMDVTPDAVPVIGAVDAVPGFHIASGFSGHGFGIGPGAGQLMADIVSGDAPIVDPAPFRLARLRPKL